MVSQLPKRIRWDYPEKVTVPESFKRYLWEYQGEAPLEMLILRVLTYGHFEEIRSVYRAYPEETFRLAFKYPKIKRGVRFWLKRWHTKKS